MKDLLKKIAAIILLVHTLVSNLSYALLMSYQLPTANNTINQIENFIEEIELPKFNLSIGLFIGGTNPGVVYIFKDGKLTAISPVLGFSITDIEYYNGKIYASVITSPDSSYSRGLVYRREDDGSWKLIGELDRQVCFLIVYRDQLYAGTGPGVARLYRYVPELETWMKVIEYRWWDGFRSAYVLNDWLYLGDWLYDKFARWNGTIFQDLGNWWGSCIYSFEEFKGDLYAGAYNGVLYKINPSTDPPQITVVWQEPDRQYIWALCTYGDYLYIGTAWNYYGIREGRLYRYNGTHLELIWTIPVNNQHEGVISLTTDGVRLIIGVGGQAVGYPGSPEKQEGETSSVQEVHPLYMPARGRGQVWTYDGRNFTLIADALGTGVQSILPNTFYIPLFLKIEPSERSILVKLLAVIAGGIVIGKVVSSFVATLLDRDCDGKADMGEFFESLKDEFTKLSIAEIVLAILSHGAANNLVRIITSEGIYSSKAAAGLRNFLLKSAFISIVKKAFIVTGEKQFKIDTTIINIGWFRITILSPPKGEGHILAGYYEEGKGFVFNSLYLFDENMRNITSFGRVNLEIVDQYGRIVNKSISQIPGASYIEDDFDGDGALDDRILLPFEGELSYMLKVIPEYSTEENNIYTLTLESSGIKFILAENKIIPITFDNYTIGSFLLPEKYITQLLSVKLTASSLVYNISDEAELGVASDATDEIDPIYDRREPPPATQPYISLYFIDNMNNLNKSYTKLSDSLRWNLYLEYSGELSQIKLNWSLAEVNSFPVNYRILFRTHEGELLDMRSVDSYSFVASNGTFNFTIMIDNVGIISKTVNLSAGLNLVSIPLFLFPSSLLIQLGELEQVVAFGYDPLRQAYKPFSITVPGTGYWIKSSYNITITISGYSVPSPFVIKLSQGWNLIGNPFDENIEVTKIKVINLETQEMVTIEGAIRRGWIYKSLYFYNASARRYEVLTAQDGILRPFAGYWIKSNIRAKIVVEP